MTRFLMSLDDAVNLVMYAFENGNQGDLFVQKSPASTIKDLSIALQEIFKTKSKIQVIGTRHGEKLYETLCTVEEINKSVDLEGYFKIPSDNRDLNYENFFEEGKNKNLEIQDYNSSNTNQLSVNQIKEKLLTLDYIKNELNLL